MSVAGIGLSFSSTSGATFQCLPHTRHMSASVTWLQHFVACFVFCLSCRSCILCAYFASLKLIFPANQNVVHLLS